MRSMPMHHLRPKTRVICCVWVVIVHSFIGIIVSHYEDPCEHPIPSMFGILTHMDG